MRALLAAASLAICPLARSQEPPRPAPIDPRQAAAIFAAADEITHADNGRLWGLSLAGPIVLVDPATRAAAANRPDPAGAFTAEGGLFLGTLPKDVGIANTARPWAGQTWTMILWPLPDDPADRRVLLAHELWHRIQGDLKLSPADSPSPHLDTPEGRTWMRLEWRALSRALSTTGDERTRAAADALTFRAKRRAAFPEAAAPETALENNEGLAEYTGVTLGEPTPAARLARARHNVERAEKQESYVRSFAYASGPAYGLLLDEAGADWRRTHTVTDDLGEKLATALRIVPDQRSPDSATARAAAYGAEALRAEEEARERTRQALLADYRARLVEGPRLRIPLKNARYEFDPRTVTPLEPEGTVYPHITVRDAWGTLTVKRGGALMGKNWDYLAIPAGPKSPPSSEDWTLDLDPTHEFAPATRAGDWTIRKRP